MRLKGQSTTPSCTSTSAASYGPNVLMLRASFFYRTTAGRHFYMNYSASSCVAGECSRGGFFFFWGGLFFFWRSEQEKMLSTVFKWCATSDVWQYLLLSPVSHHEMPVWVPFLLNVTTTIQDDEICQRSEKPARFAGLSAHCFSTKSPTWQIAHVQVFQYLGWD